MFGNILFFYFCEESEKDFSGEDEAPDEKLDGRKFSTAE